MSSVESDALTLWSTRPVRRRVLTPDAAGAELAAAGWVAVDAYRWRDVDSTVLSWPLALAAVRRRARSEAA